MGMMLLPDADSAPATVDPEDDARRVAVQRGMHILKRECAYARDAQSLAELLRYLWPSPSEPGRFWYDYFNRIDVHGRLYGMLVRHLSVSAAATDLAHLNDNGLTELTSALTHLDRFGTVVAAVQRWDCYFHACPDCDAWALPGIEIEVVCHDERCPDCGEPARIRHGTAFEFLRLRFTRPWIDEDDHVSGAEVLYVLADMGVFSILRDPYYADLWCDETLDEPLPGERRSEYVTPRHLLLP